MIQPKPPDPPIITVTNCEGEALSVSIPWTADVWAYAQNFRIILLWLGFMPDTIDKAINTMEVKDEHEEINYS